MATNRTLTRPQTAYAVLATSIVGLCLLPWGFWVSDQIDLSHLMSGPSIAHPLGTDHVGRDLFLRLRGCFLLTVLPLWGVSCLATLAGFGMAFLHIVYIRPQKELRVIDRILSLGALLLVSVPVGISAFSISLLQTTAGFWSLAAAVSIIFFLRAHQLLWGWFRESEHLGYWQANQILGGNLSYRVFHYGMRRAWLGAMGETMRFHLQIAIGIEASLSYLGFGIQEPDPSFGNILAAHLPDYLRGQWHVVVSVMVAMALCAFLPSAITQLVKAAYEKRRSCLNEARRLSFS